MYHGQESEYFQAKQKASRKICRGWVKPSELPTNREIRDEVQMLARLYEGSRRLDNLREMRILALHMMYLLEQFTPRLIGSVLTGHVRSGSDIDLHLFSDSIESIASVLEEEGMVFDIERKQVTKAGEQRTYTHIHIVDRWPIELTIYPAIQSRVVFKSSITGKAIERASIRQLVQLLELEYPTMDLQQALAEIAEAPDRFQIFESLLLPLENVKQHRDFHPEGDALYHSLQVFDLARNEVPYDEELLLAALLHDVGKGIDRDDHVGAGLEALEGLISERTHWLIEHHMEGHRVLEKSLGARAMRRLRQSEYFEDLVLLAECDRDGRVPGYPAPELEEAIEYLRELQ